MWWHTRGTCPAVAAPRWTDGAPPLKDLRWCAKGCTRRTGRLMAAVAGTRRRARFAMPRSWRRYCQVTLGLHGLLRLALAVAPSDLADWALENALVVAFVPALVASLRWFPLSRLSWTLTALSVAAHGRRALHLR